MSKWLTVFSILLVAQFALAAVLHLNTDDYAAYQAQEALLDFDMNQVDRLEISTPDARLVLAKQDDQWVLPGHDKAATRLGQVTSLLNRLGDMQKGWPVAKTSSAAQRFKLDEDEFERKLALYQGDTPIGELLIGTSPGLRQSHVRKPGESEIYSVKFDVWQASVKQEDWLEPPKEEDETDAADADQ